MVDLDLSPKPSRSGAVALLALAILATLVLGCPYLAKAQTYPDLGQALYAKGYAGTVWVDRFLPGGSSRVDAHGRFNPNATGQDRYGTNIYGTGIPEYTASGWVVHVVVHNRYSFPLEGKVSSDLYCSGPGCQFSLQGGAIEPMVPPCGPLADCRYDLTFPGVANVTGPGVVWTATVYRHVEGSVCGGELSIDMNGEPCRTALVGMFHLPGDYRFTQADNEDTNYASKPGASTTALCAEIKPACAPPAVPTDPGPVAPVTPPVTPPTPDACLSGLCSQGCPSLCPGGVWPPVTPPLTPPTPPVCPPAPACPPVSTCPAPAVCPPPVACPQAPPCPVCAPQAVCPDPVPCPTYPACPIPPALVVNTPPAAVLEVLRGWAKGLPPKNAAKGKAAAAWVLAHPGGVVQP